LASFMERMRSPLETVKSQRGAGFEGGHDQERGGGGVSQFKAMLSPMSTGDSDASSAGDEIDAYNEKSTSRRPTQKWDNSPRFSDRIGRRNINYGEELLVKTPPLPSLDRDDSSSSYVMNHSSLGVIDTSCLFNRSSLEAIDPVLKQDPHFLEDVRRLNRLYEAKFASLQAAHDESQTKIILSAMSRNRRHGRAESVVSESADGDRPPGRPHRERQRPHIGRPHAM